MTDLDALGNPLRKAKDPEGSYSANLKYEGWWRLLSRSEADKLLEVDVCPEASKPIFVPDSARYCLAKSATCTCFRIKPFTDCPVILARSGSRKMKEETT